MAKRGFDVSLFEEREVLGGSVAIGRDPPHKELLRSLGEHMQYQATQAGVKITCGKAPTVEEIKVLQPYAVFLAMGGKNIAIPLTDKENSHSAIDLLEKKAQFKGKKIVVVGSGMTGLETAEYLADLGNDVTVIEMAKEIGPGIHKAMLFDIMARLKKMNVSFYPYHKMMDFKDQHVIALDQFSMKPTRIAADACVLSIGIASQGNSEFVKEVEKNFLIVRVIGDCQRPGRIYEAMDDGFDQGFYL